MCQRRSVGGENDIELDRAGVRPSALVRSRLCEQELDVLPLGLGSRALVRRPRTTSMSECGPKHSESRRAMEVDADEVVAEDASRALPTTLLELWPDLGRYHAVAAASASRRFRQ